MADNVINLADRKNAIQSRADEATIAWASAKERYAEAKRLCDESRSIDDGIAAGIAFADFVSAAELAGRPVTETHVEFPSIWNIGELAEVTLARMRRSRRNLAQIQEAAQ